MNTKEELLKNRINTAIKWYLNEKYRILEALPIKTHGLTFKEGYHQSIEKQISSWENGNLPINLAACYILEPTRKIYVALKKYRVVF
ncbi:hypothetical protein S7335_1200 [Synechococcus sp. PCC 7335]|uniref:hypothetical protein n=1 Tax=Synechococcus sp. (strain ATCC 29403 / PCC 7335) TaxID=91464 RepID=UPI00017EE4BF|nr:hypothetical protein [Synechococcus sp. PCC 7335]EDX82496.1 hypothetical protein S7335_1200 [Synechococcus sp. PCC 7335]